MQKPTVFQSKCINIILQDKDLLASGRHYTGKTTAMITSILQRIDHGVNRFQALILTCTRELARFIHTTLQTIGKYFKFSTHLCIGGKSFEVQRNELLEREPQIVIGTPGRVYDMFQTGHLKADFLKIVAFDDAENLIDMGLKEIVEDFFKILDFDVRIAFFTLFLTQELVKLVQGFSKDSLQISGK